MLCDHYICVLLHCQSRTNSVSRIREDAPAEAAAAYAPSQSGTEYPVAVAGHDTLFLARLTAWAQYAFFGSLVKGRLLSVSRMDAFTVTVQAGMVKK